MADGFGILIMRVKGVGEVSLITIVNVVSRLKAESYPSLETTNPALPDYQLTLRRAFLRAIVVQLIMPLLSAPIRR
jgi:hypothetical protein